MEIPLGGKRSNGRCTLVDDSDYETLSKHNWWCNSDGYAIRIEYEDRKYKRQIFMHREIIGDVPKGMQVDHINRDMKDNRRDNLRIVTPSENQINRTTLSSNTSGYKGVSYDKKSEKWRASVIKDGVQHHLGFYINKEDAAKAYNAKAFEFYGEKALLNDVDHDGFIIKTRRKHTNYHGVTKMKNKWYSYIVINGKSKYLGSFDSEHDAARMHNFWAVDIHGEDAKLNVIKEQEAVI
jgi:hypothetical protein